MYRLSLEPSRRTGTLIKPVHGVGQPPFTGLDFSMFEYLTQAGIPFSRLHDVGGAFGGSRFVDIPNLFPDFDADPADPASYDFAFTDRLICALMDSGCQPVFRLGVTIEGYSQIKAYRIFPPKDPLQWARICEGVMAHYTEGWADGYRFDIEYWEIWNEPDNDPDPAVNHMWRGTAQEFYHFYTVAASHLKKRFPQRKIGGYGSCGFYATLGQASAQAINPAASPRNDYFLTFFNGFLDYVKAHNAPLDFFSWHNYDNVENGQFYARYVRQRLDEAGFVRTETSCNEWNYQSRLRGTARHAALVGGQILAFENSPVDNAMFYDARFGVSRFGALFDPSTAQPTKEYHAFLFFNRLYQLKNKLALPQDLPQGVFAAAATDGVHTALMLTNHGEGPVALSLDTPLRLCSCQRTDAAHDLSQVVWENALPPESLTLLELEG